MGEIKPDILQLLQDFSLEPPEGAFAQSWTEILLQAEGQPIDQLPHIQALLSAGDKVESSAETQWTSSFEALQSFEITPPDRFRKMPIPTLDYSRGKLFALLFKFRAAAAVLLIMIVGIGIYLLLKPTVDSSTPLVNATPSGNLPQQPAPDTNTVASNDDGLAIQPNADSGKSGENISTIPNDRTNGAHSASNRNSKKFRGNTLHIGSVSLPIRDNDVLAAFMNCRYQLTDSMMARLERDRKINLNDYSYLNISDEMIKMLQTMYTTRRNKPVRKARKMKARFNKWKKSDEKYFDPNMQHNPADVIDLSEFFFNK